MSNGKSHCSGSSDTPQIPSTQVCHHLHIICTSSAHRFQKKPPANQAQLSPKAERFVDPWTHGRVVAFAFSPLAKKDLEAFEALHENWRTHSTSLDKITVPYGVIKHGNGTWTIEIGGFPIRTSIYRGFSIAMFDDRRVSCSQHRQRRQHHQESASGTRTK